MNADIRRKLETGFRALGFSRLHQDISAGFAAVLLRLEELMGRADLVATQQRAGIITERTATARKRELRATMNRSMLHHVARVAERASAEVPELDRKFRLQNDNRSYQAFRTDARAVLEAAKAEKELLVRHGLSEPLLEGLGKALDQFDEAMDQAAAGRAAHVGAVAQLTVLAQEVVQAVGVMDGLNQFRFANDAELLAAWESAINTFGPSQPEDDEPDPGDGTTPPAEPDQVKPAA
jgi:hypothetical protein